MTTVVEGGSTSMTCRRRWPAARSTPSSAPSPICTGGSWASASTPASSSPTSTRAPTHATYLLTVDMEMEPIDGYEFASWMQGYGDVRLVPDLTTARVLSWLDRTAFVMCDLQAHDGAPVEVAPRTMLRRQVERAGRAGFDVMAASELEYYLY